MRVAIGSDHGGIDLKREVVRQLTHDQVPLLDMGCNSHESVDYPVFARAVCTAVVNREADFGILICGTGIGMSMAANRIPGVRAALCHELFTARMSREHNNANILCMGARVIGPGLALEMVKTWLHTDFAGGRHLRRLEMF
jgi:ribose 5-phosphate isomerase B